MLDHPLTVVVAVVVLGLTVVPLLRLPADPAFRRIFPGPARLVAAALAAWVVVAVLLAVLWPPAAVVAAILAGLVAAGAWWRARPARGTRTGAPPGSLSLTRSLQGLAHRDHYQREAERHGPVFRSMQPSGPVVCVVGLERGQRFVREHRDAIGPSPLSFTQQIMGGFLRYMDDETHDVYGPLFRRAMSRPVTDAARPATTSAVQRELGALGPDAADPSPALERIAFDAVLHALFGLRNGDELHAELMRHYPAFARSAIMHPRHRRTVAALDGLRAVASRQLGELDRRRAAGLEPPACALTELREHDPAMPDATCIDNLLFMLRIGSGNVASLLRWLVQMLASEPGWRERLSEAVERGDDPLSPDLVDAFVMEALRLAQSEYVYRKLVADVELDGHSLRRGWLVRICVWESHRDPQVFEHPDAMTDRFHGQRRPQTEYCPFGFDRHACNSVGLASMVARVLVEGLVGDPGVTIRPSTELARDLRHWSHWRPGPGLVWGRSAATPG